MPRRDQRRQVEFLPVIARWTHGVHGMGSGIIFGRGPSASRPRLLRPHHHRPSGHGHGRRHGGRWNPPLLTEPANLFIGNRFPAREPDVAAYQWPRIEEWHPSPPTVGVTADEIKKWEI